MALSDENGEVVIKYDYDVFGKTYVETLSGSIAIENYKGNDYSNYRLFTGREWDGEIDLYYYRARFYDSEIGRFISRDPIVVKDDVNLYAYVGNSPVMFVDVMGLEKTLKLIVDIFNEKWEYFEKMNIFKDFSIKSLLILSNPLLLQDYLLKINIKYAIDTEWESNIKVNKELRDRTIFIDPKKNTDTDWKMFLIKGKEIWLADLGNILFWYNAAKLWLPLEWIKLPALWVTAAGFDDSEGTFKKEWPINNELWDRPFYDAWYNLAKNTKTGKLTKKNLLDTLKVVLEKNEGIWKYRKWWWNWE